MRKNLGKRRRARRLRREKDQRERDKWDLRRGYSIGLFGRRIYLS